MNRSDRTAQRTTPLAQSTLHITITDLLAEYELRHGFRNEGARAIEAIYTFPIPLDAAFLGMEATLDGETLTAQVMPAKRATGQYDDAVNDGDGAVLLERLEPGLLCVSLGSLRPGEQGEIVLRFAAALGVADQIARFSLPLVHRPRYGRSKLDDIVCPSHDFAIEHPLEAQIHVRGLLAGVPVQCSAQGAHFRQENGETILRIGHAMLDRDLVLNFDLGNQAASSARWIEDGERTIGVLSFFIPPVPRNELAPRDICFVLDGSGSMQGDAIKQSREALCALAGALGDDDRIQVLRFGNNVVPLFRRPLRASSRVRAALHELADTVNANLGGTEMNLALRTAIDSLLSLDGPSNRKVVILVTDGAVNAHEIESAEATAREHGVRIFVVAVGSSAGVDVLAPLAEATGATLERAIPTEPVEAGVLRQLRRARSGAPLDIVIDWGEGAEPLPRGIAYPGDAVTALAFVPDANARMPHVYSTSSSQDFEFPRTVTETSAGWRAWAGQQAYRYAEAADRETIALRYGLITKETSAVLVKIRSEDQKTNGLPEVDPIAHMVPAGMAELSTSSGSTPMQGVGNAPLGLAPSAAFELGVDDQLMRGYFSMPMVEDDEFDSDTLLYGLDPAIEKPKRDELSPERVTLIQTALLRALVTLLSAEGPLQIDWNHVVAAICPELREDARRYLDELAHKVYEPHGITRWLDHLSDRIGQLPLSDDQEAALAIVMHHAS